jgi:hypothetical protein
MATFATLKTRVQARLIDVTPTITTEIGELVNAAIRHAEDNYNYRIMKAETALTTTSGDHRLPASSTSIPTDWKESRADPYLRRGEAGIDGTKRIDWAASEEEMVKLYSKDDPNDKGQPGFIFEKFEEDIFEVYPFPDGQSQWTDGEYRVVIPYWKYLPDLSADNDTNWFTINMDQFIKSQATAEGFLLNWDEERAALHFALADAKRRLAERQEARAKLPRNLTLIPKRDVNAPTTRRRLI